ncbi:MAG: tRNA uridine-5-carboxymethylaminomethyl(34) synthesis GTPase MnmE [Rhizobiaceae bacterium]
MQSVGQDTICALASGQLPSGIAIVRISGPRTRFVVETICGSIGEARKAVIRTFCSASGEILDRGISIWFPEGASFTGEAYAELHLHGGLAVVSSVLDCLVGFDSVRLADAGEFTMRAFLNGKIDLTEAEALADLVDAETEEQRKFAISNTSGRHRLLYDSWRDRVVDCLAEMTSMIDFADEDDVIAEMDPGKFSDILLLAEEIESHVKRSRIGEILRRGFRIAIVGKPNVGKSSLLNALLKRDAAIVTDVPGTTRDVIEAALDLNGYKVVLFDTAGIHETEDAVERIGIERAIEKARTANLVLHLCEHGTGADSDIALQFDVPVIRVGTKSDHGAGCSKEGFDVVISTVTPEGLDRLLEMISNHVSGMAGEPEIMPFRQRHSELLTAAGECLDRAAGIELDDIELKAELLRQAATSLGRITGRVDVEDLLDVIFSRFCVGK